MLLVEAPVFQLIVPKHSVAVIVRLWPAQMLDEGVADTVGVGEMQLDLSTSARSRLVGELMAEPNDPKLRL
ncbi:hypothetical protein GCM10028810_68550 [Spirosoma litoris]